MRRFLLVLLLSGASCDRGETASECCPPEIGWDATATWPEQSLVRRDVTRSRAASLSPGAEIAESTRIDLLRGAAVLRVDPGDVVPVPRDATWRSKVLSVSAALTGDPAESATELRRMLVDALGRSEVDLEEVAALRANLASCVVRDAANCGAQGKALELKLLEALELLSDACQVPEAVLNAAAINLELHDLLTSRALEESTERSKETLREAARRLENARGALIGIELADGSACRESEDAFFGVSGVGSRLAFVLDKSGSMDCPGGFDSLKDELERTLAALDEDVSFSIQFFSGSAPPGFRAIEAPASLGDGQGMFRRALLGDRGQGGGLDQITEMVARIVPEGGTDPGPALWHALSASPSTIFLLTDGLLDTDPQELVRIGQECRSRGVVVHAILFVPDLPIELANQEPRVDRLRIIAEATGGRLSMATGSIVAERSSGLPQRPAAARGVESLRDRWIRRGLWASESERQYLRILAGVAARQAMSREAILAIDDSLSPAAADVVTNLPPALPPHSTWPRVSQGVPAPNDPELLYESGLIASLAGESLAATDRLDAAARLWARCAQVEADGRRAEEFADLACRALLIRAAILAIDLGNDGASMIENALGRCDELAIARASGWNRTAMAASVGRWAALRADLAVAFMDEASASAARSELSLVRWLTDRTSPPPSRIAGRSAIETLVFDRLVLGTRGASGS